MNQLDDYFDSGLTPTTRKELEDAMVNAEKASKATNSTASSTAVSLAVEIAKLAESKALRAAEIREKPFYALIRLYTMADKYSVVGLRNQIITSLMTIYGSRAILYQSITIDELFWNKWSAWTGPNNIADAMNSAHKHFSRFSHYNSDPLTRLLPILYCDSIGWGTHLMWGHTLGAEFLNLAFGEMRRRLVEAKVPQRQLPGTICEYHMHDVPCALKSQLEEKTWMESDTI